MADKKPKKNNNLTSVSFKYAFEGILYAFQTQKNFRIHITMAGSVLLAAVFLKCTSLEFPVILLTIVLVITLELVNTSIEAAINLVSPENQPLAKIAKDLGAASVLVSAIISVAVGVLIFGPKLIEKIFCSKP